MGIRLVLGARPDTLARLVITTALGPVGIGCVLGIPATVGLAWWLSAITFGLLAPDPSVPVVAAVLLVGAGALGAWIPSRRAARVDPIVALRG
jgi:ABC-type antimicrobial peptide transport system permease subunit